jgi:hypothetical protein
LELPAATSTVSLGSGQIHGPITECDMKRGWHAMSPTNVRFGSRTEPTDS